MRKGVQQNLVREFFEYILSILKSRLFVLGIIVVLLFSVLMIRIFNVQIVNGEYYLENYMIMDIFMKK